MTEFESQWLSPLPPPPTAARQSLGLITYAFFDRSSPVAARPRGKVISTRFLDDRSGLARRARRLMIVRRSGLCPFGAADPVQRDSELIVREDLCATLHRRSPTSGDRPRPLDSGFPKWRQATWRRCTGTDAAGLETEVLRLVAHPGWRFARLSAGGKWIRTCMGLFLSSGVFGL
jgi:hypothetical protein